MFQSPETRTIFLLLIFVYIHLTAISSHAEEERDPQSLMGRNRRSFESHRNKHRGNAVSDNDNIFLTENSTLVTAQLGGTAVLPCSIRKINNGVVSWIRRQNDYQLLTVGLTPYSSDDRFLVEHVRHLQNWALKIKFVTHDDAGMYECQVSTHPATSIFINLKIIEAEAEISGAPDLHIKSGSSLRVVCFFKHTTEPPLFVFWYHNHRMINYEEDRVYVTSDKDGSILHIAAATKTDSGNYSCVPANAKPASVNIHVLNGEKPAAMQHGGRGIASKNNCYWSSHGLVCSSLITLLLSIRIHFCFVFYANFFPCYVAR